MATKKKTTQTFDAKKNYDWSDLADKPFVTLTGAEFGFIRNTLNNLASKPEVEEALNLVTAANVIQEKLVKAVEEGKAVEVVPTEEV